MDEVKEPHQASAAEVMRYFGMRVGEFRAAWAELTEKDKRELRIGIGNGTYTY